MQTKLDTTNASKVWVIFQLVMKASST